MGGGSGVSRGDRNRNARLARLRSLVPVSNAMVGIDLSGRTGPAAGSVSRGGDRAVLDDRHPDARPARSSPPCRAAPAAAAPKWLDLTAFNVGSPNRSIRLSPLPRNQAQQAGRSRARCQAPRVVKRHHEPLTVPRLPGWTTRVGEQPR
jgi:hypothetical protein